MILYWREHEFPENRKRVWTEQDAGYGSFNVLELNQFQMLLEVAKFMNWTIIEARD
jgi:hypothetical protein